jgi:hypothetical protein
MWSAGMLFGTLCAGALLSLAPAAPLLLGMACLAVTCAVAVWANSVRLQVAGA